jgi:hydroxyacylglutathione hydrolase
MNKEIEIITIKSLSDNYIWLLRNNSNNLTAVIDPGESEPVNRVLFQKNWQLNQIINTHHHYDHTNGNLELKKKWGSKLIAPEKEKNKIDNIDIEVTDDNEIEIAGLRAKVIHTPGHTLGHVMFYLKKEKILFAGDTIFSLGCGRVFEGTMQDMFFSLNKIKSLDPETLIYCGHEYTENNLKFALEVERQNEDLKKFSKKITALKKSGLPTIPSFLKDELNCNPFLRTDSLNISIYFKNKGNSNLDIFTKLRNLKDKF